MNLPELHPLRNDQSTYISFSKALLDFDKAINTGGKCYFSKMVAINLPYWNNPDFYIDLSGIGVASTDPNVVIPKAIQYYMENIIRQSIGVNDEPINEVTELAFWKLMGKMGLTRVQRNSMVTFINKVSISNFVTSENNNGWGEIVCQIPNKCKLLVPSWRDVLNISDIVQGDNTDTSLFDNGLKQFLFDETNKEVIDFENIQYDEVTNTDFQFNALLLYYKDDTGIEKLHGINFVYPFENKVTYWDLETFTQKTNEARTIGYQFKFNQKTCNNEATKIAVYELQEHYTLNQFSDVLGKLNTFLELKMKSGESEIQ